MVLRRRSRKLDVPFLLSLVLLLVVHCGNETSAQHVHPLVPPWSCCDEHSKCCPSSVATCVPVPCVNIPDPTVATDPATMPVWQLTVHEAIRIALSNSEVVRNLGLVDARSDVDIIRARITRYDPMAAYAAAAGEWGIFDPLWTTEMQWYRQDIPPGTSFSGIGNRPPELDTADFITSLEQLLPLGTRFRTDYVTDYLFNPEKPLGLDPNPQYFSYVQFGATQPVLQGLGVNVTMAPIRIAAAEAERTDWKFKQEMLALVRSVETAYWTLYAEQQNLRSLDESLPLFREIVRVREEQARGVSGTETEVARATSEYLLYEQRRLDVRSNIAEQQLVIRNLLGLSPSDGRYLTLVALPVTSPPFQTVGDAINTAVNQRPDVLRQRIAVYVAQQERVLARDSLRPKLDFNAFWRINGLGEDLGESLEVVGENDFHDWQLGFFLQVPLGRRQGRANVREAELLIQKERALLEQTAHQASFEVADAYRRIIWLSQQYQVSSDRVSALTRWRTGAQAQFENPPAGVSTVLALELYLDNLRDFVEASIKSHAILADYNSALSRLEEVKGTLLDVRLIHVAGDATEVIPEQLPAPKINVPDWLVPPAETDKPVNPAPDSSCSTESSVPDMVGSVPIGPESVEPKLFMTPLVTSPPAPAATTPSIARLPHTYNHGNPTPSSDGSAPNSTPAAADSVPIGPLSVESQSTTTPFFTIPPAPAATTPSIARLPDTYKQVNPAPGSDGSTPHSAPAAAGSVPIGPVPKGSTLAVLSISHPAAGVAISPPIAGLPDTDSGAPIETETIGDSLDCAKSDVRQWSFGKAEQDVDQVAPSAKRMTRLPSTLTVVGQKDRLSRQPEPLREESHRPLADGMAPDRGQTSLHKAGIQTPAAPVSASGSRHGTTLRVLEKPNQSATDPASGVNPAAAEVETAPRAARQGIWGPIKHFYELHTK